MGTGQLFWGGCLSSVQIIPRPIVTGESIVAWDESFIPVSSPIGQVPQNIIAQIAPLSFQGSHRTQTQTSEVRSAARFSGHWVVTSMFA